jgi:hypothetical protein
MKFRKKPIWLVVGRDGATFVDLPSRFYGAHSILCFCGAYRNMRHRKGATDYLWWVSDHFTSTE